MLENAMLSKERYIVEGLAVPSLPRGSTLLQPNLRNDSSPVNESTITMKQFPSIDHMHEPSRTSRRVHVCGSNQV